MTAVTNTSCIEWRLFVREGFLSDWSARHTAGPARQANRKCDSDIRLHDLIASPLIGIAHLRLGMHGQQTVASYRRTNEDVCRVRPSKAGHICTQS
jgi:hypothetical protein